MANPFKSITDSISKAFRVDAGRGTPKPRKGLFSFMNTVTEKKQQRNFVLNSETLKRLANTDPITWAIRRVIKGYISQTPWDIVPDTQNIEAELDRWEDLALDAMNPYGFESPDFETEILSNELFQEIGNKLNSIFADTAVDQTEKRSRIRWVFSSCKKRVKQEAESHKHKVKCIFEHPNTTETSFRALLELVLDDILVYDAGVIVKNPDHYGKLAELYPLPGQEIKIYRNEDRTTPLPPEPAYVWEDKGVLRAEFTNDELVYIMQNPQQNGYGRSPLEVAAYVITASLYADQYNIDYFKNSNVPPGIVNLGENVTEDQRLIFQKLWEAEISGQGGLHKLLITHGSDKIQFIPMRLQSNRDMQMMEYLKWTTAIKCACYGISPQDIGFVLDFHKTTSEVQEKLSKTRGVNSLMNLMASYINEEIVKAEFEFKDIKFEWQVDDKTDSIQQAQIDKIDIDSGVLSINERRKKLGYRPVEGGDKHTMKATNGLMPVEDLEKINNPLEPEKPPIGANAPQPGFGQEKPGPEGEQQVNGDPGRPTEQEAKQKDAINLSVSKKQPVKKQHIMLHKTVDSLKKEGINATLKIGFDDEKTS